MANPFDKSNTPAPKDRKQRFILGVAVVVLVVLMGRQWTHMFPASADAGQELGAQTPVATPSAFDEAQQMTAEIEGLKNDPTANITLNESHIRGPFETPPNDPFAVSRDWARGLERPTAQVAPTLKVAETPTLPAAHVEHFEIQAILKTAQGRQAIIDGNIVGPGASVHGVRILRILDNAIVCRPIDRPDAAPTIISLGGTQGISQ